MIILLAGRKQVGKDTSADYICEKYGYVKYSFAEPIKQVCNTVFDWNDSYYENEKQKTTLTKWGITPREALQWLGTEVFQHSIQDTFPKFKEKTGRHIWVDLFIQKYLNGDFNLDFNNVVISDCRFPHEVNRIREKLPCTTVVFKIFRETGFKDSHASETEIDNIKEDRSIDNNNSFESLYRQLDRAMLSCSEP